MKKFIVSVLMGAGLCTVAQAEQSRYEWVMGHCKWRASNIQASIAVGNITREEKEKEFDSMSDSQWKKIVVQCPKTDATFVAQKAPQGTQIEKRPEGEPSRIVSRPDGAPRGQFYRCNRQTLLPDPQGTSICGPVGSGERKK